MRLLVANVRDYLRFGHTSLSFVCRSTLTGIYEAQGWHTLKSGPRTGCLQNWQATREHSSELTVCMVRETIASLEQPLTKGLADTIEGRERFVAKGGSRPSSSYEGTRFSRFGWDGISWSIAQGVVMGNLTIIRRDKLPLAYPTSTKRVVATTGGEHRRAWSVTAFCRNASRF
jgi:hypothetical protein